MQLTQPRWLCQHKSSSDSQTTETKRAGLVKYLECTLLKDWDLESSNPASDHLTDLRLATGTGWFLSRKLANLWKKQLLNFRVRWELLDGLSLPFFKTAGLKKSNVVKASPTFFRRKRSSVKKIDGFGHFDQTSVDENRKPKTIFSGPKRDYPENGEVKIFVMKQQFLILILFHCCWCCCCCCCCHGCALPPPASRWPSPS